MNLASRYLWNVLLSLDQLGNSLLGGDPDETISSRVGRIKRKLTRGPNKHDSPIESVRGVGYRLKTEALS